MKHNLKNKPVILFTIFYADGLHGGVKYCMELGEFLHSKGYNVYCAGVITNDTTVDLMKKSHVSLYNINDLPLDKEFDLIWAHHFPLLPYLIKKGLKYNKIINSCISEILAIDKPCFFFDNISLFLTLTNKTKQMFITEYDIPADKITILPNTAPDCFFEYKTIPREKLNSIAIVSNHVPHELSLAKKILENKGVDVVIYGGTNPVNITPDVLSQHDVIITIGKTVQYSMAMGIPVYNYDRFGGAGYITTENVLFEETCNFSGRNEFIKKSEILIADEIIDMYKSVLAQQEQIKEIASQRYKLSTRINMILDAIQNAAPLDKIEINNSNRVYFDYCDFIIQTCARHATQSEVPTCDAPTGFRRLLKHIKQTFNIK